MDPIGMAQIKPMETKCVLFAAQMSRALQETHAFCRTWAASFSLAQCPKWKLGPLKMLKSFSLREVLLLICCSHLAERKFKHVN